MTTATRRSGDSLLARFALAATAALIACSPALDWRETRPEGTGAAMLFPCRAEKHERAVRLGEDTMPMRLHSCTAAGMSFALVVAEAADSSHVAPMLDALRRQAVANVAGTSTAEALPAIAGSTPNERSAKVRIVGKRPDGRPVVEHALFFVKGLTLFQATVIGADEPADREATDTFFGSIRFP